MNQHATAVDNCEWVRDALDRHGLTEKVEQRTAALLASVLHPTWSDRWAEAYSFGHNVVKLRNGRLAHFANAYADICEEVEALALDDLEMTLEAFWLLWDGGNSFFGTVNEDWHLAEGIVA
jgi:hypothetical protein